MKEAAAITARNDYVPAARWTAWIAAVVCIFIVTMLSMAMRQERKLTPLNSPEILSLKAQLYERPNDEELKTQLRRRDMELRSGYFARHELTWRGGWLLVAAGAALVIAMKSHSSLTRRPAALEATRSDILQENRLARLGVGVSAVTLLAVCGAMVVLARPTLPARQADEQVAVKLPTLEELARHSVAFRGLRGDGVVSGAVPETWDGTTGEGIIWKAAVPLPGHSSPVIFGGNIFLSGSDGNLQEMICFDTQSGSVKWRGIVPRGTLQSPNIFDDTGYAAPTPVTDGIRAYAIFATGDLGAFDYTGRRIWAKNLGNPDSQYGYASSLAIHDGKLIVQWDQGMEADGAKSFLFCLDGATGRLIWKTGRPVANGWASPTVVDGVIYTAGNPWVIAYDAASGAEKWRAKLLEGDVAPTPVVHDGVVYVANDRAVVAAIRIGGTGDVTESHVNWKVSEGSLPDMVSPLTDGKYLLLTHGGGEMTCLEAATGKTLWTHSVEAMVHASPILAGKQVYLVDAQGVTHVFELKESFEELRAMPLGEEVSASPAVVDGRIYIRAKEHLYCIGKK